MHKHDLAVDEVAKEVRSKYQGGSPFHIYHGSTHRTRRVQSPADRIVDIRSLSTILDVNPHNRTASVEPNVSFETLVNETLKKGLIPAVVPPFSDITVGGAYGGTSAGSSSFKHGYFERTVNRVEIILGNGDAVIASPHENPDLFYAFPGSMGTPGIATLFEIQLIPCSDYIKVSYHAVTSAQEAVQQIDLFRTTAGETDFLDGITFSEHLDVLMTGEIVTPNTTDNTMKLLTPQFTRPSDPWFFIHAHTKVRCPKDSSCIVCTWTKTSWQSKQSSISPSTELVPTASYLFRHDRATFWLGAYDAPPSVFHNRLTRQLLNPTFKSSFSRRVFQQGGTAQKRIIQNVGVPDDKSVDFLQFLDARLKIYPIYLCPIAPSFSPPAPSTSYSFRPPYSSASSPPPRFLVQVGIYGVPNLGRDMYGRSHALCRR